MRDKDRLRGCLIGGAAGDALGYTVEFMTERAIFARFGEGGITRYSLEDGKARFSDDTQMTLFTADGLLRGREKGNYAESVNRAYLDWLRTQSGPFAPSDSPSPLMAEPGLFSPRAPGNTCLSALGMGGMGRTDDPINTSKGCGGIMRAAPVGLFFNDRGWALGDVCRLGADCAALTHGHPLGWMPAAVFAGIIHEIAQNGAPLRDAVLRAREAVHGLWPDTEAYALLSSLIDKAMDLAAGSRDDLDAIHALGEGWVAEETLAIAIFCALRFEGDLDRALTASVNHRGDSDSTGAVTGNIVGAQIGYDRIPAKYTGSLELKDLILDTADRLWQG